MATVVCAVRVPITRELVEAAVFFCLKQGADLRLVGVIEDRLSESTRAGGGERVRRYKHTRHALDWAAETAQAAGVSTTTSMRVGDLTVEALREADAIGASDVFIALTRGRIRSALTKKPSVQLDRVTLIPPSEEELVAAA